MATNLKEAKESKPDNFYAINPNEVKEKEANPPPGPITTTTTPYVFNNIHPSVLSLIGKIKGYHNKAGERILALAEIIDTFHVFEHYATSGILITAVSLTYLIAWLGLSFAWIIVLFSYLAFLYNLTLKRLRARSRAIAHKDFSTGYIHSDSESAEWFNQFLERYWKSREASLSEQLKHDINVILDGIKLPGVDEIRLTKFDLGSQAPRIDAIKTFAKSPGADDLLVLDFDLSFTPLDEDSVSSRERRVKELRNIEVVLLIKVAMVPLPVSLREVFLQGKLRVSFTFTSSFPNLKVIDIGFVKQPTLDFVLKPLGADVSKIAGLGSMIKDIVEGQVAAFLVNPVKISLPLGEWFGEGAGGTELPVGVLRVMIYEAKGVKNVDVTGGISDPAAIISIAGNEVGRTRVCQNSLDPKWNEVIHVIIYKNMVSSLSGESDEFRIELLHINNQLGVLGNKTLGVTSILKLSKWIKLTGLEYGTQTKGSDSEIASAPEAIANEEQDSQLIHQWGSPFEANGFIWKRINLNGKQHGTLRIDLGYFPIIPSDFKFPDQINGAGVAGIVSITINQAKELSCGTNSSVEVLGFLDGQEILKTTPRKRTVNPSWNSSHDFYTSDITVAEVKFQITRKDLLKQEVTFGILNSNNSIGEFLINLKKASLGQADDWYKITGGSGKIRIGVKFNPIDLNFATIDPQKFKRLDPVGVLRLKIASGKDLPASAVETVTLGKVDAYCKVFLQSRTVGATSVQEKTQQPLWNETFYSVSYSLSENLTLDVFDKNNLSKDRRLGKVDLPIEALMAIADHEDYKDPNGEVALLVNDGLKVTRETGGKLVIIAPLYTKDESKEMEGEAAATGASTLKVQESVTAKFKNAFKPSNISKLISLDTEKKQKGFVTLEIELFSVDKSNIVALKRKTMTESANIISPSKESLSTHNSLDKISSNVAPPILVASNPPSMEKSAIAKTENLVTPREIVVANRTGILRIRIESGTFEMKCKPYLEVKTNNEHFYSTFTPADSQKTVFWAGATDKFLTDLTTLKFTMIVRDQVSPVQSPRDPIIAHWAGDLIDSLLGKGRFSVPFRAHSEGGTFESSPVVAKIDLASLWYPVDFGHMSFAANTGVLHLDVVNARSLLATDSNGLSDPYVIVTLNGKQHLKTKVCKKTLNPEWEEGAEIEIHSRIRSTISFEVKDYNQFSHHTTIATVSFPLSDVVADKVTTLELPLNEGIHGTLTIRYLYEERHIVGLRDANENSLLHTEAGTIGKFGKGLTSQVTGLGTKIGDVGSKIGDVLTMQNTNHGRKTSTLKDRGSNANESLQRPSVARTDGGEESENRSNLSGTLDSGNDEDAHPPVTIIDDSSNTRSMQSSNPNSLNTSTIDDPTHSRTSTVSLNLEGKTLVEVKLCAARNLKNSPGEYLVRSTLIGQDKKIHKTSSSKKSLEPQWTGESFLVPLNCSGLKLSLYEKYLLKEVLLGSCTLNLNEILPPDAAAAGKDSVDNWYCLENNSAASSAGVELRVFLRKLVPGEQLPQLGLGKKKSILHFR